MNNTIKSNDRMVHSFQNITLGPRIPIVAVPTEITVHLGAPDEDAENITIPYIDYIKNVASSELYPTWPENALRANIYAITSIAMNRIYTEWYKSRGYNFDITSSTRYDQAFVNNRGTFENIDLIVDQIFSHYVVRTDQVQPYFTQFCDGKSTTCSGMHQWGTVDLANAGYSPLDILKYYYGDDIQIVTNAPITRVENTYPGEPMRLGDSSLGILRMQYDLDRISRNYPGIPRVARLDGYFGEDTRAAVMKFQEVFNLPVTGVIDEGTWYKIRRIYTAVTKLSELTGEGQLLSEIISISEDELLRGDVRPTVSNLQFFLNILSAYSSGIPEVPITGVFDDATRNAIIEYQKSNNLPETGVADIETLQSLYSAAKGILDTLPSKQVYIPYLRWPGIVYELGYESPGVYLIQEMLAYISLIVPTIPYIEPNGVYDESTQNAVIAFQNMQGIEPTGIVDEETWSAITNVYRQQRYSRT